MNNYSIMKNERLLSLGVFAIGIFIGGIIAMNHHNNGNSTVERRIYSNGGYEIVYCTRAEAVDKAVKMGADSVVSIYRNN
jgi:methylmalonyl-CoA mutase cobalamin-binding subunit